MDTADAAALIARAIDGRPGVWADVGAGTGVFTRALFALMGPAARVYAVDRDPGALLEMTSWARRAEVEVTPVHADFTGDFELPGVPPRGLDGMLLANALHFVPDPESVLARLVDRVRPGGRVVIVEYDGRLPSPWVPHPIGRERLPGLAAAAGLSEPIVLATRPSEYGGVLYAMAATRADEDPERLRALDLRSPANPLT